MLGTRLSHFKATGQPPWLWSWEAFPTFCKSIYPVSLLVGLQGSGLLALWVLLFSTTLCRIELTSLPLGSLPQLWRPMGRSDVFKDPHSFSNTCFWLHHDSFCLLLSGD